VEYRVNGGWRFTPFYGAYAADVNLDSSALKDAVVDCSATWDGSEFQSPTVIRHIDSVLAKSLFWHDKRLMDGLCPDDNSNRK